MVICLVDLFPISTDQRGNALDRELLFQTNG